MNLEDFKRWKVDELKKYVRARGQTINCKRKEELVALAYAVTKQNLPVVPTKEDLKEQTHLDYQALLNVDIGDLTITLEDPWNIRDGWQPESSGMSTWPPCTYANIAEYLIDSDQRALLSRLNNDYKEGKAFSYFASQHAWIQDVFYHPLDKANPLCILKSECTPSQNIRGIPHKLWVCIIKQTGEVKSAYCSCFAGLGSTCNHVAALLFKVDYAWQQHLISSHKPACTSGANQWIAPTLKDVAPMKASNMVFAKPHYKAKRRPVHSGVAARRLFVPYKSPTGQNPPNLDDLVGALYPEFPSSAAFQYTLVDCTAQYQPESDVNISSNVECRSDVSMPQPLYLSAKYCKWSGDNFPVYSPEQCKMIEQATRLQAASPEWFCHRRGRISASVAHRILTKSRKIAAGTSADFSCLVRDIIKDSSNSGCNVPSLQYGRQNEPLAVEMYAVCQKAQHSDLLVTNCGLFVLPDVIYMCATPDRLVQCKCCGKGLLEVKCPISSMDMDPNDACLPYLENIAGTLKLKRSHEYYTQVQMQMAVTRREWCDFFVYSPHGYVRDRIYFDQDFFAVVKDSCVQFFIAHILPVLVDEQ